PGLPLARAPADESARLRGQANRRGGCVRRVPRPAEWKASTAGRLARARGAHAAACALSPRYSDAVPVRLASHVVHRDAPRVSVAAPRARHAFADTRKVGSDIRAARARRVVSCNLRDLVSGPLGTPTALCDRVRVA